MKHLIAAALSGKWIESWPAIALMWAGLLSLVRWLP